MAIDDEKVKAFWDSRARTYGDLAFESIANLEQDPDNLQLKIQGETARVFDYLGDVTGKSVLDLGAGVGQWAFRFVDRGASSVTAVEYSAPLAEIGAAEARRRGVSAIEFVVSPAQDFESDRTWDLVYIAGLFVYLNDESAARLMEHLPTFCHSDTLVILRDGTGRHERHEINDRMSDHLQTTYSATYRTRAQYLDLFRDAGLVVERDEDMFEEGSPLNKYPETRLRIYRFRRA